MALKDKARTKVSPLRLQIWKIMLYVAIALCIVTGWIFSGVAEAVYIGCPQHLNQAYCYSNWKPMMGVVEIIFMGLFCLSLIFLIIVLSLRCSPWYRGKLIRKLQKDDVESQADSDNVHEAPSPVHTTPAYRIVRHAPVSPMAELAQARNPVELSPDSIIEIPVNVNEKYRYDGDLAKSPQGMLEHSMR